jgi:glycosyltransferase involved in cell wall biosynthesis
VTNKCPNRPRVVLVLPWLSHYRRHFLALLRDDLTSRGIDLTVVHGQPPADEASKQNGISLPWGMQVENRFIVIGTKCLIWQPVRHLIHDADLVVTQQESRILSAYPLFGVQILGRQRMAFWGHGRNMDLECASRLGEALKRFMSKRVHWWFAYNDYAAGVVQELGFPPERITVVQNSIDTRTMAEQSAQIDADELDSVRRRLGLNSENVAIYVGGMYGLKRLPYLVDACVRIRAEVPDFHMLFVGAGPDADVVQRAAAKHDWMHYLGPLFDRDKLPYFKLSKLLLMPGRVGLVVLDAFALETPLVTIDHNQHSVELDYLENGQDGVILPRGTDAAEYATAVIHLLRDAAMYKRLVKGCRQSAHHYSAEQMAERFGTGVEQALGAPNWTGLRVR